MKHSILAFLIAYSMMVAVMFVLPYYTTEGYRVISNTTSQLGAQQTPNSWMMNIVFVLMGSLSILAGWSHYQGYGLHRLLLIVFGISLICTAIFSHAPIDPNVSYSEKENQLHSWFATITGFAFTFLAIATGFIKKSKVRMILPFCIGMLATLLSWLMFTIDELMGLWQRLIFISSFGWMIFEFNQGTSNE